MRSLHASGSMRAILVVVGILFGTVIRPSAVSGNPQAHKMAPRSTRMFALYDSFNTFGDIADPWLGDKDLLHFDNRSDLSVYNILTKKDTPLTVLTMDVNSSGVKGFVVYPSPDGKWVAWAGANLQRIFVAQLDGGGEMGWQTSVRIPELHWYSSSQKIFVTPTAAGLGSSATACVCDLYNPGEIATWQLPKSKSGLVLDGEVIVAVASDSRVYTASISSPIGLPHKSGSTVPVTTSIWSVQQCELLGTNYCHVPNYDGWMAVSNDFKRIAWSCDSRLYVSDIGGHHLREAVGTNTGGTSTNLQWSPDGRQLAYRCNHVMWVVPIN